MPFDSGLELNIPLAAPSAIGTDAFQAFAQTEAFAGAASAVVAIATTPAFNTGAVFTGSFYQTIPFADGLDSKIVPQLRVSGVFDVNVIFDEQIIEEPTQWRVSINFALPEPFKTRASPQSWALLLLTFDGGTVTRNVLYSYFLALANN